MAYHSGALGEAAPAIHSNCFGLTVLAAGEPSSGLCLAFRGAFAGASGAGLGLAGGERDGAAACGQACWGAADCLSFIKL